MKNELSKIENLEIEELIDLSKLILEKLEYSDFEYIPEKSTLNCSIKAGVSIIQTTVLISLGRLTSKHYQTNEFEGQIKTLSENKAIIILSRRNITQGFRDKCQNDREGLSFIDRDDLIEYINKFEIDFFRHKDLVLLEYEKFLREEIKKDTQLKKISAAEGQIERLKSIFVDPLIYEYHPDKESNSPSRSKISFKSAAEKDGVIIISGEAGIGKSTLLKKLIQQVIDNNDETKLKTLPIYILSNNLIDNNFNVFESIKAEINTHFDDNLENFHNEYEVNIYIDSIDEFSIEVQEAIINEIKEINKEYEFNVFCATRSYEQLISNLNKGGVNGLRIQKFGTEQIRHFVNSFFINDKSKSDYLLEALKDKMIIDRLPMTPLTISLISILYEEREFEIPATITDIYDSFNSLILGKTTITKSYDFIDINFKQRILTYYAYTLLNKENHEALTKKGFFKLIENFYKEKTLAIDQDNLHEVLESLLNSSGVLIEKKGKIIFKHDSFMEYYASVEYFNFRRDKEDDLVKNFNDPHWQNVAIFYAGRTKDMESFLEKLNSEISSYKNIHDLFSSISGGGFLLQALYETDSTIRTKTISATLTNLIKIHTILSKIAADQPKLFKNHNYPTLYGILSMLYYDHFNSITLSDPLKLFYMENIEDSIDETNGFKLLLVSIILSSDRINESSYLEKLVYETKLLNSPILTLITQFFMDVVLEKSTYKEIQKEVQKSFKHLKDPIRAYLETPIKKLRHGNLDLITPNQNVQLFFEGKTDCDIVEHAYYVLTEAQIPYWSFKKPNNGGAEKLGKRLFELDEIVTDTKYYIGIFDNDSKGIQEFKGALKSDKFEYLSEHEKRIKKHKEMNIYGIKLPVPNDMQHYIQPTQHDNYFSIEHYLPLDFLLENNVVEETAIKNIYKVKSGKSKAKIVDKVKEITDKDFFHKFICLFDELDRLTGNVTNYIK